jgi:hypothetical protein
MVCAAISWRTIVWFGAQAKFSPRTMLKLTVGWRPYAAVRCRRAVAVAFAPRGVLSPRPTSNPSSCRVAVIRGDSSTPADVDWDDADVFLAGLPDLAGPLQPPVEAVPVVCVEGESQTDEVRLQSRGTMTCSPASRWPSGLDSRAVVALVHSRPDLSIDRLMGELRRQYPLISDADAEYVRFAVVGIAWGLEEQARRVLRVVSAATDDPRSGPAAAATLLADLGEQAERRY